MNNRETSRYWHFVLAAVAALSGCLFFFAHTMSRDVQELAKDTFEAIPIDFVPLPTGIKHRILFTLIGVVLALSGGLLADDYFCSRKTATRAGSAFGSLRLWIVFLASLAIACSIFYHATIDKGRCFINGPQNETLPAGQMRDPYGI